MASIDISLLEKLFECPICTNFLQIPILMCENGHSICNDCKNLVHTCPECRAKWTPKRNLKLEQILGTITKPCRYKENGCTVVRNCSQLEDHERDCEERLVDCFFNPCSKRKIEAKNFIKHYTEDHGVPICKTDSNDELILEPIQSVVIEDQKSNFYTFCPYSVVNDWTDPMRKMLMYTNLSKSKAASLKYLIVINYGKDFGQQTYEGKVLSVDEGMKGLEGFTTGGLWIPKEYFSNGTIKNAIISLKVQKKIINVIN